MTGSQHTRRAVIAALLGNGAITIGKLIAGMMSGSVSILAEAAHSFADTFNQVFLLIGLWVAKRPPDSRHPFGYGKARFFWSFVTAVMLFVMGGFFSVYEGVRKILDPHPVGDVFWAYVVLGVAFVFELGSLAVAVRAFRLQTGSGSFFKRVKKTTDTTLLTVLFEDSAALIGLVLAFLGLWLSQTLNIPALDGAFSVFIGIVLFGVAVFLAKVSRDFLIGKGVPFDVQMKMEEVIMSHPCISALDELLTMYISPHDILVVAHVVVDEKCADRLIGNIIEEVEKALRETVPDIRYVFIEPE